MSLLVHGGIGGNGSGGSDALVFDRLEITKPASATNYYMNSAFSIEGLEVTAIYTGNETEYRRVVTNECTYNPAVGSLLTSNGTMTVMISYIDLDATKTTSYDIYVKTELDYYSAAPDLPPYYSNVNEVFVAAMAATNNYMLIKATNGRTGDYMVGKAYNSSMVTSDFSISQKLWGEGASVGTDSKYAIFAGGLNITNESYSSAVTAYGDNLVSRNLSSLPYSGNGPGRCSGDIMAVFAGGQITYSECSPCIVGYNSNLVQQRFNDMIHKVHHPGVGINGNTLIVGGGYEPYVDWYDRNQYRNVNYVYIYAIDTMTLIGGYVTYLTQGNHEMGGAAVGDSYIIFVGGYGESYNGKVAECWTVEGTKLNNISLMSAIPYASSAVSTNNGYAITAYNSNTIVFSPELVQFQVKGRPKARDEAQVATMGDYTFMGCDYNQPYIDVYKYTPA